VVISLAASVAVHTNYPKPNAESRERPSGLKSSLHIPVSCDSKLGNFPHAMYEIKIQPKGRSFVRISRGSPKGVLTYNPRSASPIIAIK